MDAVVKSLFIAKNAKSTVRGNLETCSVSIMLWLFHVSLFESNIPTGISLIVKSIAHKRKSKKIVRTVPVSYPRTVSVPKLKIIKRKIAVTIVVKIVFDRRYEELHVAKSEECTLFM